jgi:lipid II:glycine glycyltransferase (peptidoglycan interpeptide bridge formation enzyme)/LmbE family N-acetylglucosaminyl deacetylase
MLVSIDQLPADYQHVYLSPHFDDAALSLGGTLARQSAAGERALVVTVCSAPPSGPLNPFAAHLHERWGGAADPISVRRGEDEAAVSLLGADLLWLDELDAIYRDSAYASVEAIFAAPAPGDPLPAALARHLTRLRRHLPQATWYAPLAIGNHVDHQITRQAALETLQDADLLWYEDLPYAARQDAVADHIRQRLPGYRPLTLDIERTLPAKLGAIAAYASQMVELFGDEAAMEAEIGGYARQISPAGAERLWQSIAGDQPAHAYAIREADAAEWAAFVASRPDAHLLQRAEWGALKSQFGWDPQWLVVADRAGILGGAQVLWRSQWGLRVAYVPRGPVWARAEPANALLIQALERLARRRHAVFLRLEPNSLDDGSFDARHSALLLAGFEPTSPTQPEASIHLDLAPEAKDLLGGASKGHRADVRRAERLGVSVRVGHSQADLDSFYAIMQATGQRAGFNIHSREYYAAAWRLFGGDQADGDARLLLAEFEGAVVAAFLVFASGAEGQYMYSGASEAGLKNGANHALQWAAIQWARSRGCAIYDFWGIPAAFLDLETATDPAERERLEAAAQATGMAGVYRFKKGWGGAVVKYAPAYDRVFLRPAYWIWRKRNPS